MDIPELERSPRTREYKNYTFEEISRLVKHWLFIGDLGHRNLEREILGIDPEYFRGFQSMGILHYLGLKQSFKGIFQGLELPYVISELKDNHQDFTEIISHLESDQQDPISPSDNFERLRTFIQDEMLMHAVYQPVMLRELLKNGPTSVPSIARAIWTEDSGRRGGPSTYEGIVTNLPGPVLYGHGLVSYDDASDEYSLELGSEFTREQLRILLQTCDDKITEYLGRNEAPAERGQDSRPDGESRWLRQGGQGHQGDPEERRAVEVWAVQIATDYYEQQGYEVEDVGARCSYDLRCTKGSADLHVEVKGTRGHGTSVILTKNEVSHARVHRPVSLFIVTGIKTERTPEGIKAHGGMNHILDPWEIDAGELVPDRFTYHPTF